MKEKKPKTKETKLSVAALQKEILQVFKENPRRQLNPRQISKLLATGNNKDSVLNALMILSEQGYIHAMEDFKFMLKRQAGPAANKKLAEGIVDVTRSGSAYIDCEGMEEDVYVSARGLASAMHGDRVQIAVWTPRGRRKPEGEVIKVLERASDAFVGKLVISRNKAVVVPLRPDVQMDVDVDMADIRSAEDGDRVVVRITKWHDKPGQKPKGVVTVVLGAEGSDLEMKTILINNGFNLEFPDGAMAEANDLPEKIALQEINRRRDFRKVPTFTIDPEDAKDFDDALSIQTLENGNLEIGVHIADVTHYLKPGSLLDKEALKRSTSVYLVDRVLPMLPERISNNLCSLRPNEDKLTFSAVFEIDKKDKVVARWFGKTIIHSQRRFAYEEAQQVLTSGKGDYVNELKQMNRLAKKMRKDRFRHGAIDFDMEEVRFRLDEDGVPIEVYVKERMDAHMLIEEFMLLANREVATFIHEKGKQWEIPFVYRIHDFPNQDKVIELAKYAKELGFEMKVNTPKEISASFNALAKASEKDGMLKLLQPIAIRTMAKAEYSPNNIGHYGLAFDYYSHFTSPIRRYSDVVAHRILEGNLGDRTMRLDKTNLEEQCKHISLQERKAMDAERQSVKYKQVEFMEKHVGDVFDGIISGMIDRGIFVEIVGNKCEGMVGFDTMSEPFLIDEGRLRATGKRSGTILKMGQPVKVLILETNLEKRQIEMELVEDVPEKPKRGRRKTGN